jgi:hypothetical protein
MAATAHRLRYVRVRAAARYLPDAKHFDDTSGPKPERLIGVAARLLSTRNTVLPMGYDDARSRAARAQKVCAPLWRASPKVDQVHSPASSCPAATATSSCFSLAGLGNSLLR